MRLYFSFILFLIVSSSLWAEDFDVDLSSPEAAFRTTQLSIRNERYDILLKTMTSVYKRKQGLLGAGAVSELTQQYDDYYRKNPDMREILMSRSVEVLSVQYLSPYQARVLSPSGTTYYIFENNKWKNWYEPMPAMKTPQTRQPEISEYDDEEGQKEGRSRSLWGKLRDLTDPDSDFRQKTEGKLEKLKDDMINEFDLEYEKKEV